MTGKGQARTLASIWNNPQARAILYQALALAAVFSVAAYLVGNTLHNLEERQIRSGFGFLDQEAGFHIGESILAYAPGDSYLRAFVVGLANTLTVAVTAIVTATLIGTIVGLGRLSHNWLVVRMATVYVETLRNIPLLLQLFFWYGVITGIAPIAREAPEFLGGAYLSKSGLRLPVPIYDTVHLYMIAAVAIGIVATFAYQRWASRTRELTGRQWPVLWPGIAIIVGLPAIVFVAGGAPTAMDIPEFQRFRFSGGIEITPEFLALAVGLGTYTATFIAEVLRGGILAVDWGQTEAARAVGLRQGLVLRLVILPQALRVIVPPLTNQYLNLTKNSSLAVAIGYPDLFSVGSTTLNQTGQAVEVVAIMMAVYLTLSLAISAAMNWYNTLVAIPEH